MDREKIGKKLTELRGSRSRKEVADNIGVTVSALQMYEKGVRVPRDETKERLAKLYNVNVGELFFDEKLHKTCGEGA